MINQLWKASTTGSHAVTATEMEGLAVKGLIVLPRPMDVDTKIGKVITVLKA